MAKLLLGSFTLAVCENIVSPESAVTHNFYTVNAQAVLEEDIVVAFSKFKRDFHRQYDDDSEEHQLRLVQFKRSFTQVHHLEGAPILGGDFVFGEFSDATADEVSLARNGLIPSNSTKFLDHTLSAWSASGSLALADAVDWRTRGAVTAVKNQAFCGSCWAFTTTGVLEGAVAVATGSLIDISEEQFLDCDVYGQDKCTGGFLDKAISWATTKGLCSERTYPYKQGSPSQNCEEPNCNDIPAGCVRGYQRVLGGANGEGLLQALNVQPVAVEMWFPPEMTNYHGGVVSMDCPGRRNHGVVVVGYRPDAWIVKNSHGVVWGEMGYAFFDRQAANPFCIYSAPIVAAISDSCDVSGGGGAVSTRDHIWQRFISSILFWPSVATLAFMSCISVLVYLRVRGGKVKRAAADGTSTAGVSMLGM